jgi:hypothetical protein
LVVQAALFVGFLSAFLIELLGRLEPDPMDIIQDVLIYQTQMMRNSSLGPYVPPDFTPPEYIVIVNALFYASLGVMFLAAFIAMLIKSWVREFDRGLRAMSLPEQRAKTREFRFLGMERWKLPEMVGVLPWLIQISLLLFAIGLILFLFHISRPSFGVTTGIFGVGVLFYAMTTSISVFVASSPFHSPLSRTLGNVYQRMHAHFCPSISVFLSETMDTTPGTVLGRVRRDIQIILQKSRPYPEKYFAEPIVATTMDEVQLSVAALALQRIHESAPNSQYSEALQWSVWQVAGSATLRNPPLFNLPSWILSRGNDEEYFSHLPPAMLVTLAAVSLRARRKRSTRHIATIRSVLQRVNNPWAQLVSAVFDRLLLDIGVSPYNGNAIQAQSNDFTNMIQKKRLHRHESLWLLRTLSELLSAGWLSWEEWDEPFFITICLSMLLDDAPKWDHINPPDIVLLEAVVTLAAISSSPRRANRLSILNRSCEHPWLLLNIRDPHLISTMFESTPSDYHKQLISLLFLVLLALIYRGSYPLAIQYFTIITAKGDLPLYTSALTAIAPSISDEGLSTIGRMLLVPQTQELTSIRDDRMFFDQVYAHRTFQEALLTSYDHQFGASENPDPNIFAILLMFSKHLPSGTIKELQNLNLELKNPWLRLAARVVAQLDIPDGSGLPMGLFHDHRVHNMIAALSLLRYTEGKVTEYTESLLLASFLESRDVAISSVALEYSMKTAISYSDPPAASCYLSTAVSTAFNFILPDHQLRMGWNLLDIFVDGYEKLSVDWRRTFAEGFFTLSRRPLPRSRGDMDSSTRESELEKILTWEYFHEEERQAQLTDSDFSGLDWMATAWSLHLFQESGRETEGSGQGKTQSRHLSTLAVNEGFVLRALHKLLDAAPYYQIIPIIPKLREFVQWFDGTELLEYRCMISTRVKEAVHGHHEFQILHRFHKFHCTWYM